MVARMIDQQKVIGWFQGRFEWGPRALGNRSILADPRPEAMKLIVNEKIKFREPFRPFAPAVLEEHATEFFECPEPEGVYPLRYMLMVRQVQESKRSVIRATTHHDVRAGCRRCGRNGTRQPALIDEFGKLTGVPILLNTSFNLRGEPMVTTPANAYNTFMNSGIDELVIGNYLVSKNGGTG